MINKPLKELKSTKNSFKSEELSNLELIDLFDLEFLQKLQDKFAFATGVASIITYPEGKPLCKPSNFSRLCNDVIRKTEKGLQNCMRSDAVIGRPNITGPIMQPCLSCGLWDGGASIFAGEKHVANWLIGQIRHEEMSEPKLIEYAHEIGADETKFREAFKETNIMSKSQFSAVCDFLFLMANQLSSLAYEKIVQLKLTREKQTLQKVLDQSKRLQAIGQLTGGIAHDFNNLLTVILGNVELILMDLDSVNASTNSIRKQMQEIQDAGMKGENMVRQLLAFSRQQISVPKLVNLNLILDSFDPILHRLLPEIIQVKYFLESPLPPLMLDQSQMEQILLNIVVNSRDAMPKGGILRIETYTVLLDKEFESLHPGSKEGRYVCLSLIDNGVGMSTETQEHLFEPFFSTKPLGEGTGLGLATVYGIVQQSHGYIEIQSALNKGTSVFIYFPAAEGDIATQSEPIIQEELSGHETILVCEDSPQVLRLAENILQRAGYRVYSSPSGIDALQFLKNKTINLDLLITDVIMPGMNGKVLADEIHKENPNLPVLFTSGYTANIIGNQGVVEENVHFLSKPYSHSSLLRIVRKILNKTK